MQKRWQLVDGDARPSPRTSRCLIALPPVVSGPISEIVPRRGLPASNAKHHAERWPGENFVVGCFSLPCRLSVVLINGFCGLRSITITGSSLDLPRNPCAEYHLDRRSLSGIKNRDDQQCQRLRRFCASARFEPCLRLLRDKDAA